MYHLCCKPYHDGALPETAEKLMRARYCAYALGLADYIMSTTHPENPNYSDNKDQWKADIMLFSRENRFLGLKIIQSSDGAAPAKDGAAPAKDGAAPAKDGAHPAKDGAAPAKDGAAQAKDGAAPAKDGAPPGKGGASGGDERATVTFVAHIGHGARDASFKEKSEFAKVGGRWLYLDGEVSHEP